MAEGSTYQDAIASLADVAGRSAKEAIKQEEQVLEYARHVEFEYAVVGLRISPAGSAGFVAYGTLVWSRSVG